MFGDHSAVIPPWLLPVVNVGLLNSTTSWLKRDDLSMGIVEKHDEQAGIHRLTAWTKVQLCSTQIIADFYSLGEAVIAGEVIRPQTSFC